MSGIKGTLVVVGLGLALLLAGGSALFQTSLGQSASVQKQLVAPTEAPTSPAALASTPARPASASAPTVPTRPPATIGPLVPASQPAPGSLEATAVASAVSGINFKDKEYPFGLWLPQYWVVEEGKLEDLKTVGSTKRVLEIGPEPGTDVYGSQDVFRPLVVDVSVGTEEEYRQSHPQDSIESSEKIAINGFAGTLLVGKGGDLAYVFQDPFDPSLRVTMYDTTMLQPYREEEQKVGMQQGVMDTINGFCFLPR